MADHGALETINVVNSRLKRIIPAAFSGSSAPSSKNTLSDDKRFKPFLSQRSLSVSFTDSELGRIHCQQENISVFSFYKDPRSNGQNLNEA